MGGKSTKHHIVAAWRTSMSRKVPVLKFGVMCRGTTLFYFWWFRDQDYFVLQAAFNAFFFGLLGFNLCVQFFWDFVAKAFYISYTVHFFLAAQ